MPEPLHAPPRLQLRVAQGEGGATSHQKPGRHLKHRALSSPTEPPGSARLPRFCLEHKLVSRGFPTLSRTGSLPGSPHRLQASLRCAHPFLQPPSGLSGPPLTVAQVTTPPGAALLPPKVCPDRALTPKGSTQGDRVPGWGMHCRHPPPWPSPFPAQPRTFCACYGCYSRGPGLCSQEWGT